MLNDVQLKSELRKLNILALLLSPVLAVCLYLAATTEIPKVIILKGSVEKSTGGKTIVRAYVQDLGMTELKAGRFTLRYENYPPSTWGKIQVERVDVHEQNAQIEGVFYIGFLEIAHSNTTNRDRKLSPEKGFPVQIAATIPGQSILQMLSESF